MILKRLFQRSAKAERSCYEAIVAAARHPVFYADWGVPDTVDGRFDMIALHSFLVLDRLKGEQEAFRQALVDEFFADMDRSLREMGVGDLSVGKKVRKMAEAFYGRLAAYDQAVEVGEGAMAAAISRNIFPDQPESPGAGLLAGHVMAARAHLAAQEAAAIAGGRINFREPTA